MTTVTATKSVSIKASRAKVWEALTNPEMIKKYFFGSKTTTDWKVGSPVVWHGEWEGTPYEDKGIVLEIEKDKLIRHSYWSSFSGTPDTPENYNNITYTLSEKDGETVVSVVQEGVKDEAAKKQSEDNWGMVMAGMKKLVEEGQ